MHKNKLPMKKAIRRQRSFPMALYKSPSMGTERKRTAYLCPYSSLYHANA